MPFQTLTLDFKSFVGVFLTLEFKASYIFFQDKYNWNIATVSLLLLSLPLLSRIVVAEVSAGSLTPFCFPTSSVSPKAARLGEEDTHLR